MSLAASESNESVVLIANRRVVNVILVCFLLGMKLETA
jgi:hypothetical protein